ncbi:hypothetical protein BABINDRAFT_20715, partial [Babjeviella inositovora NRRL Y-12698]
LVSIFGLSRDETLLVLQAQRWNEEMAMERYMEDEGGLREAAGLPHEREPEATYKTGADDVVRKIPSICPICCDDTTDFYGLSCTHLYCRDCYSQYISTQILRGTAIKCPEPGCGRALPHLFIARTAGDATYHAYLESVTKLYITASKSIKYCPAPDCGRIVASNSVPASAVGSIPIVECLARHLFCFACNYENHVPAPCFVTQQWIAKCKDDSETANWISSHTNNCPKCESAIEKNGGCNHMVCKSCQTEFCWICMGDWKLHGTAYYQCNRFNDKDPETVAERTKKDSARWSLKRYIHYYNLFQNHDLSLRQDCKLFEKKIEPQIVALRDVRHLSVSDILFFFDAHEALVACRKALKWTYVIAYYLQKTNFQEIFESNQDFLTSSIEELSQAFVQGRVEQMYQNKKVFVERASLVRRRKDIMVEAANAGLKDG